jgi:hypothetical protein
MGSIASGNFRTDKKTTIEACLALDLRQLQWCGAVQPGARRRGILHESGKHKSIWYMNV